MANGQKWTRYFFFISFCPQLILQFIEGIQWFDYRENYTFARIQMGSYIFQGVGIQFFPGGGVLIIVSKETHITCDFPGGSGPPIPPLDPHMQNCNLGLF